MRVVMFGHQTWGHRTLQALLESSHEVVLAVTHPKSDHAYEKIWDDSVAELAAAHDVPVLLRNRPTDPELLQAVKDAQADIIVANNWRTWLPPEIYDLPPHGTLNVHDSLLPKYAGFSPIIWALINGEAEVGVTAHRMTEDLDAGDILIQRSVPVLPTHTATDLFFATVDLITPIVHEGLDLIESGSGGLDAAGSVAGVVLPQAGHRGQPHRLDVVGGGTGAAGPGAVGSLSERLHLLQGRAGASARSGCVGGVLRRDSGTGVHP